MYLGECPKIKDGRHFLGNKARGKNIYGSARTPDSITAKTVDQPGSDSPEGVWRHWERSATGMYSLPLLFNIYAENIFFHADRNILCTMKLVG